jgi:hypothetical protein
MLLAERLGDATRVQTAVQQIEVAFMTMRDGKAPAAAYDEAQLLKARAPAVNWLWLLTSGDNKGLSARSQVTRPPGSAPGLGLQRSGAMTYR